MCLREFIDFDKWKHVMALTADRTSWTVPFFMKPYRWNRWSCFGLIGLMWLLAVWGSVDLLLLLRPAKFRHELEADLRDWKSWRRSFIRLAFPWNWRSCLGRLRFRTCFLPVPQGSGSFRLIGQFIELYEGFRFLWSVFEANLPEFESKADHVRSLQVIGPGWRSWNCPCFQKAYRWSC